MAIPPYMACSGNENAAREKARMPVSEQMERARRRLGSTEHRQQVGRTQPLVPDHTDPLYQEHPQQQVGHAAVHREMKPSEHQGVHAESYYGEYQCLRCELSDNRSPYVAIGCSEPFR